MNTSNIKLAFFGTSAFAVPALEAVKNAGYNVVAVITNPDEPAGRNKTLTPPPIKITAGKLGLRVLQPETLRNNTELFEELKKLNADIAIVAAYGKFIPLEMLSLPKNGILNIHPSLLPKYRGPSPIQYALLNGDKTTGVSIIKIDEQMDHGPILTNSKIQISNDKKFKELHDELAKLGAEILINILPEYLANPEMGTIQDESAATFTKLLKTQDGEITLNEPATTSYNKIRALNPQPGTFMIVNGKRLKILEAELKDGKLVFQKVQLEGGKPINWQDFERGHPKLLSDK
jgi:methionyl-tRNA formyltransferase